MRRPAFKARVDARLLRLPLLGRLLRDLYAARFARTLSTMVSSRLPLVEGLKLTVPTIRNAALAGATAHIVDRSEEHTSELQSLMRISYAVFCLKQTTKHNTKNRRVNI